LQPCAVTRHGSSVTSTGVLANVLLSASGMPAFAEDGAPLYCAAAVASSATPMASATPRPVLMSTHLIWSGVQSGCAWRTSADAAATCGAENDVPFRRR